MFGLFARRRATSPPAIPAGSRAYAIGDIHGRLDLLRELLARIEEDVRARPPERTFLIFLGDLIDRGPESRGVVEFVSGLDPDWAQVVLLLGNHEEAFLEAMKGDVRALQDWLRFGGRECVESYGVDKTMLDVLAPGLIVQELDRRVPPAHRACLEAAYDSFTLGDYLFVHAGIRPGVAIEDQDPQDLRWIREDFLHSPAAHGHVVVHGHTIVEEAADHGNRIAIDTGAYRSGVLTALRLEGAERSFMAVRGAPSAIDPA